MGKSKKSKKKTSQKAPSLDDTTTQPSEASTEASPSAASTTEQLLTTEVVAEAHAESSAPGLDVNQVCKEIGDSELNATEQGRLLALLHVSKESAAPVMQLWQRSNPSNRLAAVRAYLGFLPGPGGSSNGASKDVREEIDRLQRQINDMGVAYSVIAEVLDYDEDAASVVSVPEFKRRLVYQYSNVRYDRNGDRLIFCMVTHQYLPSKAVIGGHLWKRVWQRLNGLLMGFEDIHDSRNGLLLFKIIEWAYDTSALCLIPDTDGDIRVHILNPELLEKNLVEEWVAQDKDKKIDADTLSAVSDKIGDLSFKDIQGRWLRSEGAWHHPNPFRRVLWYQARRACIRAKKKKWDQLRPLPQVPSVESVDFADERKDRLDRYFASMENQGIC